MRIGSGFDVHAFGEGDFVMLGGVRMPYGRGVIAHSDGDVMLHALCDALLGARGLGDIGQHFRDDDPQWRGADSQRLRARRDGACCASGTCAWSTPTSRCWPRRRAWRSIASPIRDSIAAVLDVAADCVNVKATTTEKMGFLGRGEGLAAQAAVLLRSTG